VQHPLHLMWLVPLLVLAAVVQDAAAVLGGRGLDASWSGPPCPADVIVVMGAAQYDGRPSPAFERRLDGAAALYRAGCAPLVVVSGGRRDGDRFSEGEAGAAYLRARGLGAAALVVEDRAATSVQNLRYVEELVGAVRMVVVTDDLHAYRTSLVAKRLGLTARVEPVPTRGGRLAYAAREVGAILAYRLGVFR
jgi:uncharacterized SAM-binding protein YcdF (DUF218 family)